MIKPKAEDVGRAVVYTGNRYPDGKKEDGIITSFNNDAVFVRYRDSNTGKATSREDLEWFMT